MVRNESGSELAGDRGASTPRKTRKRDFPAIRSVDWPAPATGHRWKVNATPLAVAKLPEEHDDQYTQRYIVGSQSRSQTVWQVSEPPGSDSDGWSRPPSLVAKVRHWLPIGTTHVAVGTPISALVHSRLKRIVDLVQDRMLGPSRTPPLQQSNLARGIEPGIWRVPRRNENVCGGYGTKLR